MPETSAIEQHMEANRELLRVLRQFDQGLESLGFTLPQRRGMWLTASVTLGASLRQNLQEARRA